MIEVDEVKAVRWVWRMRRDTELWSSIAQLAVLVGCMIRIALFFANPSLGADEAAVARNIIERSPQELLAPLDYAQVAPPGFLLAAKASTTILGVGDRALRLVPLVGGIASVVLFYLVAGALLSRPARAVGTWLFALAVPLISYSVSLKPYSSDVAATLAVVGIALWMDKVRLDGHRARMAGVIPVVLCFLSESVVFALVAAGATVVCGTVVSPRRDRTTRLAIVAAWALGVVGISRHGLSSMTVPDSVYMHQFWEKAFVPGSGELLWVWTRTKSIFGPFVPNPYDGSLHYSWPGVFVTLAVVGCFTLYRRMPLACGLIAGPFILVLLAAWAQAYPFGARVGMFLLPLLLLLAVNGADSVGRLMVRHRIGGLASLLLLLPGLSPYLQQTLPLWKPEHLRPVMEYLSTNWKSGDALWVYYGAGQAFEYYRKVIPIQGHVRVGECDRENLPAYLGQLDELMGRSRVWILMAHDYGSWAVSERGFLTGYLGRVGILRDQFHALEDDPSSNRAEVYLYDLSGASPRGGKIDEHSRNPKSYPSQRWTCYGTMSPLGINQRAVEDLLSRSSP